MSIQSADVEKILKESGFNHEHATQKVIRYRSTTNNKVIYFRLDSGLPGYARIVIHPDDTYDHLKDIAEVSVKSPQAFQHGSNMTEFPRRLNKGEGKIHYGRAFNISSLSALTRFASVFHDL